MKTEIEIKEFLKEQSEGFGSKCEAYRKYLDKFGHNPHAVYGYAYSCGMIHALEWMLDEGGL
jgi:hypothetical protein